MANYINPNSSFVLNRETSQDHFFQENNEHHIYFIIAGFVLFLAGLTIYFNLTTFPRIQQFFCSMVLASICHTFGPSSWTDTIDTFFCGMLLSSLIAIFNNKNYKEVVTSSKTVLQKERKHKKGSFLLTHSIISNHDNKNDDIANNASIMKMNKVNHIIASKRKQSLQSLKGNQSLSLGPKLITERQKHLGPNVSCFYADEGGLIVTRGEGCYLIDMDGNRYLDCCNNVACVGHSEPRVVQAGVDALKQVQTNGRFLHPTQDRYVKKLLSTFPKELDTIYLVNSGSEANDLALRIARAHADVKGAAKKPNDVICLDSAYHGHTQSLLDISPYKWYQSVDGKSYQPSSTHVATLPDTFRGKYRGASTETAHKYAAEVSDLVRSNGGIGVFFAESIVGCGGQVMLPPGYLTECYQVVREGGGVCIADEVQTGFGRSGIHFWQFQNYNVVPDIVTFGKPMGNGYPVAGLVCRREVAESFASSGIEYFNTYGGNSVACNIAEAVLDVIVEDNLQSHSHEMGQYLLKNLSDLQSKFDWIGDVRGQGLFLGVEFVHSRKKPDYTPFAELCKFVVDYLRYDRIIISRDGPDHNVIKIKPPLVFGKQEADALLHSLRSALECAKSEQAFEELMQ